MEASDIPLRKIDHVRFFVGNARQSAFFYRNAFTVAMMSLVAIAMCCTPAPP
jgi:hypothetical protein